MIVSVYFILLNIISAVPTALAFQYVPPPEFNPCNPVSDIPNVGQAGPSLQFCAEWNPEFPWNGHNCCRKPMGRSVSSKSNRCSPQRRKNSFCDEMTPEQHEFVDSVVSGKEKDVLSLIANEMGRKGAQAYCTVNNGFLAWGRKVVPTFLNRVELRTPQRCTDFGTDHMVGMVEWLGRQIGKQYSGPDYEGVRFLVGDISAPRGGCLPGKAGRRGHVSHTSGLDADFGFLTVKSWVRSPSNFHNKLDPEPNWWLLKQMFKNPYACVKVVFLDRTHIKKLASVARGDEDWVRLRRFIRHSRGHRNHFHVRIGDSPGQPGCVADPKPELEEEEDNGENDYQVSAR